MAKGNKRTRRKVFAVILLTGTLVGGFTAFYLNSTEKMRTVFEAQLNEAKNAISSNTRTVYITTKNIKYGEMITEDNIAAISTLSTLESAMFISAEDIGSIALVDIPLGTVITENMVTKTSYSNALRETQFDIFVLNSNLTNGDFVDVRIRYKNGEDYVVFSKKCVKNLSLRNAVCFMDLTEEELQLISSAIVDASSYDAILYTTTYLEPSIQEASTVTYQPSKEVLNVIRSNPNILEVSTQNLSVIAREAMEKRLFEYENTLDGTEGTIFNVSDVPEIEDTGNIQNGYVDLEDETESN